jgi:hypothetical protein
MRQGMARGRSSPDRKGTSRVSKPATGRMHAQGGSGTSRRDPQEQGQRGPAPAPDNKNTMYIGIGAGALVFVLILAFMLSGGESEHKSGVSADTFVNRAISKATEAYQRGEYRVGLDICDQALSDPKSRRSSRSTALQALANQLRAIIQLDATAQTKVGEFKRRIEAAKADQTAMAKANDLYAECLRLLGEYGATTSAKDLRGIKEDLGRWVSTEGQGNWQKDYNVTKGRIEKTYLGDGRFGEAIREWQRFGETSQDPLLRSRIEQEVRAVNQHAQAAAEKVVAESAGDRAKLEESQSRFNGTDGQAVINKALKAIK